MLARIKFPIEPIVNNLLDSLPDEVWTSETTRFLDPSIGGGQFVHAIEQRLLSAGHTKENIANRVYGYAIYEQEINYAVRTKKLVGKYRPANFLTEPDDNRYDVIVSNPPFHDTGTNKKGNLWSQYIVRAKEMINLGGYVGFISPPSWMSGTNENGNRKKKEIHDFFATNDILYLDLDVGTHFKQISSHFSAYLVQLVQTGEKTKVISNGVTSYLDLHNFKTLPKNLDPYTFSIVNKFLNYPDKKPFTAQGCVGHPKPDGQEKYRIHNTGSKFGSSKVEPTNAKERKVVVSVPGKLVATYDDGKYGCSINSGWMPVKDLKEADTYINAVNSKLVQFIFDQCKYSGFNNIFILKSFPTIISSDDKKLYKQFGLTAQEIDLIESS